MPAQVLCIARRLPLTEEHVAELERIAGVDVNIVEVNAGDREQVLSALSSQWSAIWARGLPEDLMSLVRQHRAAKLVTVRAAIRQGRQARQGGINDRFDHLELRCGPGETRSVDEREFANIN